VFGWRGEEASSVWGRIVRVCCELVGCGSGRGSGSYWFVGAPRASDGRTERRAASKQAGKEEWAWKSSIPPHKPPELYLSTRSSDYNLFPMKSLFFRVRNSEQTVKWARAMCGRWEDLPNGNSKPYLPRSGKIVNRFGNFGGGISPWPQDSPALQRLISRFCS